VTGFFIVLTATIMIGGSSTSPLPNVSKAHAASISITLTGCVVPAGTCTSAGWWEGAIKDPTITVSQGDTVTLRLSSADRNVHQFIVDVDGTGTCSTTDPCSSMFSTGTTLTFIANMASGTYTYACTIHPQMVVAGGFRVNPAPPPPADFSISTSPGTLTTNVGAVGNSTITVAPQNGFAGTVGLTATTNSTNLACSIAPTSISGGSGNSILSCGGSLQGNYLATVTGTSGSLSHSASVSYKVMSSGTTGGVILPGYMLVLSPLYIRFGLALVGVLAVVLIYTRRRTR
jgi:hypothetical protein